MHGTNIVLDINTGAVHVVDEITYNALEYIDITGCINRTEAITALSDRYNEKEIVEAIDEIDELINNKLLFTADPFENYIPIWSGKKPVVKALCLHIAHDCNLRCKYCFASTGDYSGQRSLMSLETGKRAIDFLIRNSANRRNLEVDFFGGEPLMNFDVVKGIVEYARGLEKDNNKNFRFTITTNMLLLNDDILDYINKNMSNVVLSIDGRKAINDKMRKRVNGTGCYDKIVPIAKKVAESRNQNNYYVRGTFTRNNLDFAEDVLHLADLGFEQISVEPVVAAEGTDIDIRKEDIDSACREYERLAYEYIKRRKEGNWFNFFHFMIDLEGGPCVAKRMAGCGSGHEYLAVTPEGDLYPCHQFVGDEKFYMGSVYTGFTQESETLAELFKKTNIYTKTECSECWAKFYCSGGCAANAYQFNKDINIPYKIGCELEKKRVECALWIKAQESM